MVTVKHFQLEFLLETLAKGLEMFAIVANRYHCDTEPFASSTWTQWQHYLADTADCDTGPVRWLSSLTGTPSLGVPVLRSGEGSWLLI